MADFKDTVKTIMQTNALFTLAFVKYDILTEHPRMLWFPMIINEYAAEFQSTKTSKDAKFKQCLYLKLPPPPVMSRTDAQNALHNIFKAWLHSVRYTTRIL